MKSDEKNKAVKIGITGATGGLGRRLVEMAVAAGFTVKCLIRSTADLGNLKYLDIELIQGDLHDKAALMAFAADLDVCIHLAAMVGMATKAQYRKVNTDGTANMCDAIATANPDCHLLFCSTISALRINRHCRILSTDYALSKYDAEIIVEQYRQKHGLKATIIYPGLIFGGYDINFVPKIIEYLKKGKMVLVSGGEKNGPLIHADDLCNLFLTAVINNKSVGRKYLGTGNLEISIHRFITIIAKKMGYPPPKFKLPKSLLLPVAVFLESLFSCLGKKPPLLSKRTVDFLSINFKNQPEMSACDIGWRPRIPVLEGLEKVLNNLECG